MNKWYARQHTKEGKRVTGSRMAAWRVKHFGLELEENKSRLIEFGRYAGERHGKEGKKPETFAFLGFTHYCSQSGNGKFRVKRKTNKKKFAKKCRQVHREIAQMRTLPLPMIIRKLNQMLVGYYHYYGITDNSKEINDFYYRVQRSFFYWLNRRSQKKSCTWEAFNIMLNQCLSMKSDMLEKRAPKKVFWALSETCKAIVVYIYPYSRISVAAGI